VTVFSTGKTHHQPIAIVDHPEISDGFAHTAQQSRLSFMFSAHFAVDESIAFVTEL